MLERMQMLIFLMIFITLSIAVASDDRQQSTTNSLKTKRSFGIQTLGHDGGQFPLTSSYQHANSYNHHGTYIGTNTHTLITKKIGYPIPEPIPIPIEKHIPIPVKIPVAVPIDRPYPVTVFKPYPVTILKHVAVPINRPIAVPVHHAIPVPIIKHIGVPYPIGIPKPFGVPVPIFAKPKKSFLHHIFKWL